MRRDMVPLMDDAVTLRELQKLMYFMQEAGEALRLELLGCAQWVAKHESSAPANNSDEATVLVNAWNDRKRNSFPKLPIEVAWIRLSCAGWL